jgi:hypothetical protein
MRILKPYLIGQMTIDRITYQWREDIVEYAKTLPREIQAHLDIINPCANNFSMQMFNETDKSHPENFATNVNKYGQSKLFPAVDKAYVKEDSNCAIFNANHYTKDIPFIGTIFELAWYHDQPWKPVVGVLDGDPTEDFLCKHPFVGDTVHTWVKSPIEAFNLLVSLLRS